MNSEYSFKEKFDYICDFSVRIQQMLSMNIYITTILHLKEIQYCNKGPACHNRKTYLEHSTCSLLLICNDKCDPHHSEGDFFSNILFKKKISTYIISTAM